MCTGADIDADDRTGSDVEYYPRGFFQFDHVSEHFYVRNGPGNPTWGEERIAAELLLKVGIRVSARTI